MSPSKDTVQVWTHRTCESALFGNKVFAEVTSLRRGTKEPLDEGESGEWKSWLKTQHSKNQDHGIWSHHFMANRWGKMETVTDFIFLGSKITADGDCNHEIKRHLLLGTKAMTNLDGVLKSRDTTLPTKVHIVKAMVFPVIMYGGESWTIKKAEHQRSDAFEMWCWRRLLRVPWTARKSILKEINPEYSLGGLMLKLKLQHFGYLMKSTHWKRSDAGEDWRREEKGTTKNEVVGWHHRLNGHESEQTPGDSEGQRTWHAAVHGVIKCQGPNNNILERVGVTIINDGCP